jgi:hypothetical protein
MKTFKTYKLVREPDKGTGWDGLPDVFTRLEAMEQTGITENAFAVHVRRGDIIGYGWTNGRKAPRAVYELVNAPATKLPIDKLPARFTSMDVCEIGGTKSAIYYWVKAGHARRVDGRHENSDDPWHPRGKNVDLKGLNPITGWSKDDRMRGANEYNLL